MSNIQLGFLFSFLSLLAISTQSAFGTPLFDIMSPNVFVFVQSAFTAFMLIVLFGALPEWHKFKSLSHHQWFILIVFATLIGAIAPILAYTGWSYSTANNMALLSQSEFLFTSLLGILFLKEKITVPQIIGTLIILIGIYIIANQGSLQSVSVGMPELLILAGCFCWALASLMYKKYLSHIAVELILIIRYSVAAIIFGCIVFTSQQPLLLAEPDVQHGIFFVAYCVSYLILSKYFTMKAMQKAPMHIWSTVMLSLPLFSILFNYLLLGDVPKTFHYIGGAIIITGFAITNVHYHKTKTHHHVKVRAYQHTTS